MNEARTNALYYNLEQVLTQRDRMTAAQEDCNGAEMDDTESYCRITKEDYKEICINIIQTIFGDFQVKMFRVNAIKEQRKRDWTLVVH